MVERESSNPASLIVYIDAAMRPLVIKFLDNRRRDIDVISQALEKGDFETIEKLGHNLKGAGASYGFPIISTIGLELQHAAIVHQPQLIVQNVLQLSTYLDCVEIFDS